MKGFTLLRASRARIQRFVAGVAATAFAATLLSVDAAVLAYVPSHTGSSVTVVDTASNALLTSIAVGSAPIGVAASPDGRFVYVASHNGNAISVISTNAQSVVATIVVAGKPMGVAVSPDGSRLYVTHFTPAAASGAGSVWVGGTLSVIDTLARTVLNAVNVGANPAGVAVAPNGSRVYVANAGDGTVSVVTAASNTVTATLAVQSNPVGVAASADGQRVYVANSGSASLSVIDAASLTVTNTITVGGYASGVAVSDDSSRVLVSNNFDNSVSVIDAATLAVVATIKNGTGAAPTGVAFIPGTANALVANTQGATLSRVATASVSASVVTPASLGWPISLGKFIATTPPCALDVSGDNVVSGASDGLLILRYLLGVRGSALIQNVSGIASGVTAPIIEQRIAALNVDADGDGTSQATTDGLLLVRAMLHLTDAALIGNARNTGFGGVRNASQILQWISDTHGASCLL
ncbi:MAG: hypothetical protein LC098_05645 [Burkholderiales bacterium]|nr:hypothetical protein [Burkholderiales bacterium]